jgi:HlyD family secretion protein
VSHARARAAVEAVRAKQLAAKVMKAIQIAAPVGGIVAEITVKDGDKVQKGQILARLDDRKARLEVERAQTTVKNAEAEVQAAGKKTDEAQTRLEIAKRLYAKGAIAAEDLRLAELTHANSYQEFLVRKAAVQLTIVDLKQAELNLDMHVIRSPINGIIRKLHKNSGEGVRKLDTVVGVEPE